MLGRGAADALLAAYGVIAVLALLTPLPRMRACTALMPLAGTSQHTLHYITFRFSEFPPIPPTQDVHRIGWDTQIFFLNLLLVVEMKLQVTPYIGTRREFF